MAMFWVCVTWALLLTTVNCRNYKEGEGVYTFMQSFDILCFENDALVSRGNVAMLGRDMTSDVVEFRVPVLTGTAG